MPKTKTPPRSEAQPISVKQARIFDQIADVRNLSWKSRRAPVVISRDEAYRRIIALNEKGTPSSVIRGQGELLRALRLIGPNDDLADRIYRLARANLAGFYDQHADQMFLIDDLPDALVRETLTHELVHALQDQHFDLARRLAYRPGQMDALAATHGLCEGEATAATFEITTPGASLSPTALRIALMASLALSEEGPRTPRVLQTGLVASYIDGYRFVRALRARGGWAEVDRAWLSPPETTEQLLHLEKYDVREKAKPVAPVAQSLIPPGHRVFDSGAMGEQGLRTIVEQWVHRQRAVETAAGWGGDRYTIFKQGGAATGSAYLALWSLRFDEEVDARELESVLRETFDKACDESPTRGALLWRRRAERVAIIARSVPGSRCDELAATLKKIAPNFGP